MGILDAVVNQLKTWGTMQIGRSLMTNDVDRIADGMTYGPLRRMFEWIEFNRCDRTADNGDHKPHVPWYCWMVSDEVGHLRQFPASQTCLNSWPTSYLSLVICGRMASYSFTISYSTLAIFFEAFIDISSQQPILIHPEKNNWVKRLARVK